MLLQREAHFAINLRWCSSTHPKLSITSFPRIGESTTQRMRLICLVWTTCHWKIVSSTCPLPFGVCRQCARHSLKRAFDFSIPIVPILLLWSIARGGGKTHILQTLVMHKFEEYNPTWGNVGVYHLDEMYDCDRQLYSSFLRSCLSMRWDTSSTFFVFLSPQFLINHRDALNVFVTCAHNWTLRVIAMDEAHIHVQHGTSFRKEIRALWIEFFKKIFGNQPRDLRPRMIALTATLPTTYVGLLSNLLIVDMSIGDCVLRGSPEDFRQREITMKMNICSKKAQFVSKGLVVVAEFLQANSHCSAIVFWNSCKQSQHFAKELEKN